MENKPLYVFGETILPGERKTIEVEIAKLHTKTKLKIPIIVERSLIDGPVVLFSAGLHGDEINGTEIVRQLIIRKINKPARGTIICIPIINIFGFVNQSRQFPDGRDLNRVFQGSKNGSLAGRFAHFLVNEIIPLIDYAVDFHSGGAKRFNAPQIRIIPYNEELKELATVFNAPFTLYSKNIAGSFRSACTRLGVKMLLFEGGKSLDLNQDITREGVDGSKRFLKHLNMLSPDKQPPLATEKSIFILKSMWIRATYSGMFIGLVEVGSYITKGAIIATISDPFGKEEIKVKSPYNGYLINVNKAPIVYQGDAIFNISTQLEL